ncbi:MAG: hypothetical protein L3J59_06025 [Methylococcaceae bacterium]|nr:hypothetical protein [Methylococcaceae bacterium]
MEFSVQQKNEFRLIPSGPDRQSITRTQLKLLISRGQSEGDMLTTGYLLQVLGDKEAEIGNIKIAHLLHRKAINLDADTPLPHLIYATGLLRAFNRPDLAIKQIRELRSLLQIGKWKPTVNEPSRHWYLKQLNFLCDEIKMTFK